MANNRWVLWGTLALLSLGAFITGGYLTASASWMSATPAADRFAEAIQTRFILGLSLATIGAIVGFFSALFAARSAYESINTASPFDQQTANEQLEPTPWSPPEPVAESGEHKPQ
jgi:Co/Zn/Cd efflux system component